jgi:hypothetical protein
MERLCRECDAKGIEERVEHANLVPPRRQTIDPELPEGIGADTHVNAFDEYLGPYQIVAVKAVDNYSGDYRIPGLRRRRLSPGRSGAHLATGSRREYERRGAHHE